MAVLLFALLIVFMLSGIPVGFAITLADASFLQITGAKPLILVAQRLFMGMNSFPLVAIALFTFAGYLMEQFGISKRLVDFVNTIFGRSRGATGIVTIIACALFAAMTGSAPATVAAIGSMMIPSMIEKGYPPRTAAGITASAGVLGPIIPPSIAMIVYGSSMNLSIPKMFLGAVVPGVLITLSLCLVHSYEVKYKFTTIRTSTQRIGGQGVWKAFKGAFGCLLLPVIILGGIYSGICTPTEAATIAVIYVFLLGLVYREITFETLKTAYTKTIKTSAMVIFVIASANLFGWLISAMNISNAITEFFLPLINSQFLFLVIMSVILFVMGCLTDCLVTIVVLGPILVPIGIAMGIDPLHLGVAFCVNLMVGFVTPPFGINLFTASAISGVSFNDVLKGALPYIITLVVDVLLVTFIPSLITFLPGLMYG